MKIEKVNEHQIRCTLTQEDLASRKLKLSELAYGSEKAKELFRDMMEKANEEYGFDADNIPLMIEAIPVNSECIVLIITKVEDPEELDTRFSKFAPGIVDKDSDPDSDEDTVDSGSSDEAEVSQEATGIADLFKKFRDAAAAVKDGKTPGVTGFDGMAFAFDSFNDLAELCKTAHSFWGGSSSLYLNESSGTYLLTLCRDKMDVADFIQACNFFSEYGAPMRGRHVSEGYLREHYELVVLNDAVEVLSELN